MEDEDEPVTLLVEDGSGESTGFHPWFAMRSRSVARAAVALTVSPDWLRDPDKLALLAVGDDKMIAAAVAQDRSARVSNALDTARSAGKEWFLDLCAGVGTMGAAAVALGFDTLAVEISIVPHLIDRVLHELPMTLTHPSVAASDVADGRHLSTWRGLAAEIEDFADAVWRGAKARLKQLFEDEIDIRIWVRMATCPLCGASVPLISNPRIGSDTILDVSPDSGKGGGPPRFALLRTGSPNAAAAMPRGTYSCPTCLNHFQFRALDLPLLDALPVAVRRHGSSMLEEIESPSAYVKQVSLAADGSLAASARPSSRAVLAEDQLLFHDALGKPVCARNALLPRQRAYFRALAESMDETSAALAERAELTAEHKLAVRSAVGLLISGQIDYVNTFTRWTADRPHPPTSAGSLRFSGVFAEVGGAWLDRFWANRLRRLLSVLRQNSAAGCPVHAIQADAAAVPLKDGAASAVVWDPPYYDNVDYYTAGEPYQAVLAAMLQIWSANSASRRS